MPTIILWFALISTANGGMEMPFRLVFNDEADCQAFVDKAKLLTATNRGSVGGYCISAKVVNTLPNATPKK
jgi:hypothetical protein